MQTTLNIPPTADLKISKFDLKMTIGVALYEKGVMSSGFAAKILGIPRADFIRNMGKYGRSILEKTDGEIKEDALVAKQLIR